MAPLTLSLTAVLEQLNSALNSSRRSSSIAMHCVTDNIGISTTGTALLHFKTQPASDEAL